MYRCSLLRVALFAIGFICVSSSYANVVSDTIYLNRGTMLAVDSTSIPYFAFNSSSTFDKENERIFLDVGDTMQLLVVNTDSLAHGFDIKYYSGINTAIPAYDSAHVLFVFQEEGAHIFYDPTQSEAYRYMGAGGMIICRTPNPDIHRFFWNMKDHQVAYNELLNQGGLVDWSQYYPDYFTINGNSNPYINQDTAARITGSVGDTIYVYMVNTGQSVHSIHLHGYHGEIIQSSKFPFHQGRSKDTVPVYSMEVVILRIVPDQPGEYPVHDHNLVAVSGGNIYPNGMFLTMVIN